MFLVIIKIFLALKPISIIPSTSESFWVLIIEVDIVENKSSENAETVVVVVVVVVVNFLN